VLHSRETDDDSRAVLCESGSQLVGQRGGRECALGISLERRAPFPHLTLEIAHGNIGGAIDGLPKLLVREAPVLEEGAHR
jgi:hypothetical protein